MCISESPPSPRVQLYVEQDQKEVLEGSSVSLRCSAETVCSSPPPTLTWSSTPRIPLSESSRLLELISDLNFTATHREHGVTFTCTITYQLQDKNTTTQESITVHVLCKWYALWCFVLLTRELCYYYFYCEDLIFSPSDSPKNTSVAVVPSSSVLEGSSVTLICSSDGNPVVNYTLSRENEGELEQLQTGDTLTFNRTDPTHRGRYHCTAVSPVPWVPWCLPSPERNCKPGASNQQKLPLTYVTARTQHTGGSTPGADGPHDGTGVVTIFSLPSSPKIHAM